MKTFPSIPEKELISRAKTLYFDKMPSLEKIFVDEYGRFAYEQSLPSLMSINGANVQVFEIKRAQAEGGKVEVNDLSKPENVKKTFPKKDEKK